MNTHYSKYNNMLLLALYTGMRIGEVLALTINDFDFDEGYGTISVNKTLTKNKSGKIIIGNVTKTKNGKRNLHLGKVSNVGVNDYLLAMRVLFARIAVLSYAIRMGVEIASKEKCGNSIFFICICLFDIVISAVQLAR